MVYNNIFEYIVVNKEIIITKAVDMELTELIVPRLINRLPVVEIEDSAFKKHYNLKSLHLPDTLKKINRFAFEACTRLQYVTIMSKHIEISHAAFRHCYQLETVNAAGSIGLGRYVFAYCESLRHVKGKINRIGYKTFENCGSLSVRLAFAEKVYRFHGGAFNGCNKLPALVFEGSVEVADGLDNDMLLEIPIMCYPECCLSELAYIGANVDTDFGEVIPF